MSRPAALATWVLAGLSMALATNQPVVRALVLVAAWTLLARRLVAGRHLRPLWIGLVVGGLLTVALNGLASHTGATVLVSPPTWLPLIGGPLTMEGFVFGAGIALGLVAAVSVAATLSLAIEPSDLVDALPWWLGNTTVAVGSALNLVPSVATSYVAVRDAQRLRGWRPPGGRRILRAPRVSRSRATRMARGSPNNEAGRNHGGAGGWVDLVVPVLLGAIESSVQLGEAMEARAFGSGARHSKLGGPASPRNLVVAVGSLLALAGFAVARLSGTIGTWYPYPTLATPALGLAVVAPPAVLCVLALLIGESPA